MCLYTLNEKPLIAEKDIECYKIVIFERRFKSFLNIMTTPYMGNRYSTIFNSITISAYDSNAYIDGHVEYDRNKYEDFIVYEITKQGVHCYAKYEDAKFIVDRSTYFAYQHYEGSGNVCVVKCIIPKGTKYWTNTEYIEQSNRYYGTKYLQYAAEKLKVIF